MRLAQVITGPLRELAAGGRATTRAYGFPRSECRNPPAPRARLGHRARRAQRSRRSRAVHVFDQRAAVLDPLPRLGRETIRGTRLRRRSSAGARSRSRRHAGVVAVEEAVKENLEARVRPRRSRAANGDPGRSAHRPNGWARPASRCGRRHAAEATRQADRPRSRSAAKHRGSRRAAARGHSAPYAAGAARAFALKKLHLMLIGFPARRWSMRIVDVSAFYSPSGGGVRTYVEAKLRAAPASAMR